MWRACSSARRAHPRHGDGDHGHGTQEQADLAATVLEKLIATLRKGEKIDKSRINYAVELAKEGQADQIDAIMQDVVAVTARGRQVRCKTLGQRKYVKAVKENTVTFAVGPAGTGKTYLHGHGSCGL